MQPAASPAPHFDESESTLSNEQLMRILMTNKRKVQKSSTTKHKGNFLSVPQDGFLHISDE